jgi:hypothetical protein
MTSGSSSVQEDECSSRKAVICSTIVGRPSAIARARPPADTQSTSVNRSRGGGSGSTNSRSISAHSPNGS